MKAKRIEQDERYADDERPLDRRARRGRVRVETVRKIESAFQSSKKAKVQGRK
jgi:hypothetical protein